MNTSRNVRMIVAAVVAVAAAAAVGIIAMSSDDKGSGSLPVPTLVPTTPTISPPTRTGPPAATIVIAAAGDIACDPGKSAFNNLEGTADECRMKATSDLLLELQKTQLDAVLTLGDNQYEDGARAKYDRSYDPTWGRLKSITHPAPGNHDYRSAAGYHRYFGAAAGDPTKGYYSWDLGAWHFVVLNSNCSQAGGCGRGSPQEVWLRANLAASSQRCTLAYWHHPRFSSGRHGSSDTYRDFWQALYEGNADVILTGHDHTYERFAPLTPAGGIDPQRGIRSFVVGTGGRSHYRFDRTERGSEVRNNTAYGVLKMSLADGSYDWSFVAEPTSSFADSGSGTCH